MIDGHLRVTLAMRRSEPSIPVAYVRLSEAEEAEALATFDPIGALATIDAAKLDELLRDVQTGSAAVQEMLADLAEEAGLYVEPKAGAGGDEFDTAPQEGPTRTRLGDLWQLGGHRLLVDDCTVAENVSRLMGGQRAEMMVTDPPYGVEYAPAWRDEVLGEANRATGEVANDNRADWRVAWELFAGDVAYCWHADRRASEVQASLEGAGFEIRCQIIWAKQHFVISRGHYHWQHEPCWYAVRKGASAGWGGDRSQTTLWQINNGLSQQGGRPADEEVTGHGTQKPIECMARPIRNHDAALIYDPFLGSGTTLIACERLGRKCYGCELEPKYADVILRRWEAETGREAVLVERVGE
jgi:DNA modification methylase